MQYRRSNQKGGCYFFTVVTHNRIPIFQDYKAITVLRQAMKKVKLKYPFIINAIVILPDHIHAVWTLPEEDANFSLRWRLIKTYVSKNYHRQLKETIWQKRFWEHQITTEEDFQNHVDYIHYNPVKHGYVFSANDWVYSSFNRFVDAGIYPKNWGSSIVNFDKDIGNE